MKEPILALLLAVAFLSAYAQDAAEQQSDQERAAEVCKETPDVDLQKCADDMVILWNSPEFKAEQKKAKDFGHAIFKKCKSMDYEKFRGCSDRLTAKISDANNPFFPKMVSFNAYAENIKSSNDELVKRKEIVLSTCQKLHIEQGSVRIGMTTEMVKLCGWGSPESINRSIYRTSVQEQWVYGTGQYLYLRNGILESIQDQQ